MKCIKCHNEVNGNFCKYCGTKVVKKLSIVSIISIILLILITLGIISLIIFSIVEATSTGNDAFGWLLFIIMSIAFFTIPYFFVITVISIVCDKTLKKNRKLKDIIISIFLLLPVLIIFHMYIEIKIDTNKRNYTFKDVVVEFPKDMYKYSYSTDFDGKYSMVSFSKLDSDNKACSIRVGKYERSNGLTIIEKFKESCDRFESVDKEKTVYDIYDDVEELSKQDINGKEWYYYENQFEEVYYKMYGTEINNNFYKIEITSSNKNHNECDGKVNDVLNSVKYK